MPIGKPKMPAWRRAEPKHLTAAARSLVGATCFVAAIALPGSSFAAGLGEAVELVDPNVLRVCADPRNLPFSNKEGEGFENKLAELIAGKLGKSVSYTWYPQAIGFVRNTLRANRCDVIMGYPQGDELVQNTNPYYRTAYAMLVRHGAGLEGLTSLSDPRLKGRAIGVIAGTPPATSLAVNGLLGSLHSYQLMVDTRNDEPAKRMVDDLAAGEIDVALLWGPIAGYHAKRSNAAFDLVPLVHEDGGPRMVYRITMGVRPSDQEWKRTLNRVIRENQSDINALLADFGVPLLDEQDRPIAP